MMQPLDAPTGTMNLAPTIAAKPVARKIRWARAAVAVWVVGALLLLYAQDLGQSRSLSESLARVRAEADSGQPLDRRLAIAGYLRPTTPGPWPTSRKRSPFTRASMTPTGRSTA